VEADDPTRDRGEAVLRLDSKRIGGERQMEYLKDLSQAKAARDSGSIDRNDYWRLVQSTISSTSQLSNLLKVSGSCLKISSEGIVLNYPLTQNRKIEFFVDSEDTRSIGVSVVSEGRYEPILEKALLEVSLDCRLFCDVGANAGFYSIAVRATNTLCKVLAFECNPEIRSRLWKNIELNNMTGIDVRSEALAEYSGEADFYVPAFTGSGGGSLEDLHPEEGIPKKFRVSLISLDSIGRRDFDLMKIDVEGSELGVIIGSLASINSSKPTIFIELLRKWMSPFGATPGNVSKILTDMGYNVFELGENYAKEVPEVSTDTDSTNFVFVHPSRDRHFQILRGLIRK